MLKVHNLQPENTDKPIEEQSDDLVDLDFEA